MELPFSIQLNTPLLVLCILPVLALLIWRMRRTIGAGTIRFSGLEFLVNSGFPIAENKRRYRALFLFSLALLLAFAWVSPEIRTNRPLLFGPSQELSPTFLIALDVSTSMTEPLGGYVVEGELNIDGLTRFDATQQRVSSFVGNYPRAKIGLILFSVQPMLVRWPTLQTEFDFKEILGEGIRYNNPARQRPSQLARFAGGTSTRAGLIMANDVLMKQTGSNKSLILVADFIDDAEDVIDGIKSMNLDDIYTHVLAVDAQPENLELVKMAFKENSNMQIYPVKSVAEMDAAFSQVVSIENKRQLEAGTRNYVQNIRWIICLAGFAIALTMIFMFETKLHKTY